MAVRGQAGFVFLFQPRGDDGDANHIFRHGFIFGSTKFQLGIGRSVFVHHRHDFFVFVQNKRIGRGGNVHQHAARAAQAYIVQQGAGNGLLHGDARAVCAFGFADAHHRHAGDAHHVFHVGKVQVNQTGAGNHLGNARHAVAQHVIRRAECLAHGNALAQRGEQFIVGHNNQRINVLFQQINTLLRYDAAFAFVFERARYHGNGQNAHFFGDFGNHGGCACACAATHAGGDEQHIRAADSCGNRLAVFQRRIAPHIGVCARAQAAR